LARGIKEGKKSVTKVVRKQGMGLLVNVYEIYTKSWWWSWGIESYLHSCLRR